MLKKAIRTLQNYFPFLGEAKNDYYHFVRTRLGVTHDRSYAAIRHLPRRGDELFIDVGGNRGQSIIAFRRFRPGAEIVSFEPNPFLFAWLDRHFRRWPRVSLHRIGLGARPDTLPLYVPSYRRFIYDGLATLRPEHARSFFSSATLFRFNPARIAVTEVMCEVRTLDSFALAPTFIKIDVEGGEKEVLLGGLKTIEASRPVLMLERFYDKPEVPALLTSLGYVQVALRDGRFERGTHGKLNMFWMPAEQVP